MLTPEEDGRAASVRTVPGPVTVRVWSPGVPALKREATLVAGETTTLEIEIPREGIIRGQIVYPAGWRIIELYVTWTGDQSVVGELDAEGRFNFMGVGHGKGTLRVFGFANGEGRIETELNEIVPDGEPVLIRLEHKIPAFVTGRIEGVPLPRKALTVLLSRKDTSNFDLEVDKTGHFETPVPTRAAELLVICAEDSDMALIFVDLPRLAPGDRRDVGLLRFSPGIEFRGELRDAMGKPVAGVEVAVAERWADELKIPVATTDEHGAFTVAHLPPRPLLPGAFPAA